MDYVQVILTREDCYECGESIAFREPDKWDAERKPYSWEHFFEVPKPWLERWQSAEKAYGDMQEELTKIIDLPAGQNRITHDASR